MLYEPGISSSALPRGIAWGLPAAVIFAGVVLSKPLTAGSSRILHALGAASYSLYLTHPVLLIFMALYFTRLGLPAYSPLWLTAALWLLAAVLVAAATYVFLERPVTRFLQRRVGVR